MDKRIRLVAVFSLLCFGVLFLQLNNLQVRQAGALQHSVHEPSTVTTSWNLPRGDIITSDGTVLAYSTKNTGGTGYVRHYTNGPLYADVTGYYDWVQQAVQFGIEDQYNSYLVQHESSVHNLGDLLTQTKGTDTVETTISAKVQAAAAAALAPYASGAVVAIDPTTGDVLAMYSKPGYDPNQLSSADGTAINKYYNQLVKSGSGLVWAPLNNGVTYNLTAPGSTFKVITTAAILDHDPSLALENVKYTAALKLPQTNLQLHNFAGEVCGGTLAVNLWKSCDTAYGQYGLQLGGTNLAAEADAFGMDKQPPIDLPSAEVSVSQFPAASTFPSNQPSLAYSAIGQENVADTVLQDALVAAGIANGGKIMAPHLMAHVLNDQGQVVASYKPSVWLNATSIATADQVRQLMLGVVTNGTAAGVFPPSLDVAAKTGTAEVGNNNCSSDWMIATGPAGAGQVPKVAVAAVLPYQPGLSCDGTGAQYAGPIVAKVLESAVGYAG
jgi:peptidoglycan glycosyltransferase